MCTGTSTPSTISSCSSAVQLDSTGTRLPRIEVCIMQDLIMGARGCDTKNNVYAYRHTSLQPQGLTIIHDKYMILSPFGTIQGSVDLIQCAYPCLEMM